MYSFEKLVIDETDPKKVEVVFVRPPEKMYGAEWPVSRFVMAAEGLDQNGDVFTKLVKGPSPNAVVDAKNALKTHFDIIEARAQMPSVLAGRTQKDIPNEQASVSYSAGNVIPLHQKFA